MPLFYKPRAGYVGDWIPFWWDGAYHILRLLRAYDFKQGALGVFVSCGEATFESMRPAALSE